MFIVREYDDTGYALRTYEKSFDSQKDALAYIASEHEANQASGNEGNTFRLFEEVKTFSEIAIDVRPAEGYIVTVR